jgi:hypothetical protein
MSWITLQTRTGPEEYQVSDLDEVVWWKTENAVTAVGYMDAVSGRMTQNDLETCRIKRPEIVHEILQQQGSRGRGEHRDH